MSMRTPIPAIRKRCLGCAESLKEIRECLCTDCQLYEYRMGHRPKSEAKLTPRKAIAAYCTWCMGWRGGRDKRRCIRLARECGDADCPLWHLRPGQKPTLKPKKAHVQQAGAINSPMKGSEYPEQTQVVISVLDKKVL